jgi:hypothetical protein
MVCPRCGKTHFNSFKICRYSYKMPVNKCLICGFLWIKDEDLMDLAKDESKKLFIETLREMGKNDGKQKNGN